MTTASKITLVRVVLIPVYMVLMLLSANGADWLRWAAVAVFVIASISDFLDGYIARHYNQTTDFGKFMDPIADKLLVSSALISFVGLNRLQAWIVIILIAREFIISGFRLVASDSGIVLAASWWGKFKTAFQMIMCILLIINIQNNVFTVINNVFIYISLALSVISLADYLIKNRKVISDM